ncbi:MAG: preprotein translocase subunit SecY [bacterium]
MLSAFTNSFRIPELRARIVFTLGLIFVCRLVANVPIPGVDALALQRLIASAEQSSGGGMLGLLDMFSGGALRNCAVGALGIMPYISASIILQLLTAVVPSLGRLAREGDSGRQKITQYSRFLTVFLCIIQGWFLATTLENPANIGLSQNVVLNPGLGFRVMTVVSVTAGSVFIMWLGEQITQRGIGNGISLIITEGIVSRLPAAVFYSIQMFKAGEDGVRQFNPVFSIVLLLALFAVVAGTILLTQGQRKIPIQYAKRMVGRKQYGGQSTYMPLRINYSGVMPIIFAQSILMFPMILLRRLPDNWVWAQTLANNLGPDALLHMVLYGVMILFFSYFWVATQFQPVQIADDLKKYGGYVPGVRPGTPTAEFLDNTMTKITLAGAIFLTVIAVIPTVMNRQFDVPSLVASFFGGTSLLITVGVMLDTMRQVESHLLMRHYDGFLRRGKLRGRR